LGGFANLTADGKAWDIAACNLVLNALAQQENPAWTFDPEGQMARSGKVIPELNKSLNGLAYYQQAPPKSLGTEWLVSEVFPLILHGEATPADRSRTYIQHLAHQIGEAVRQTGITHTQILITGGGTHNTYLMEEIQAALQPYSVQPDRNTPKEIIDYKEAIVFAFLGLMTLLGRPNTLKSATGARMAVPGGSIHLPPMGGYALL
jgi:anhydro-N-acetylmuramic acid kinase